MLKITLDARLSAAASLVRIGSVVADIGTDHAYLPSFLVQNGICPSAIAADIREMPLESAKRTINACELGDRIKTVLSDGLDEIKKGECDDVVLAGMGGELIVSILERTPWISDSSVRIIAQPMSHHEDVRRFFYENGFEIIGEVCAEDKRHCYCVIAAQYIGKKIEFSPAKIYVGTLGDKTDECTNKFLDKQFSRIKKRYDALCASNKDEGEINSLRLILEDFVKMRGNTDDNG